MYRTVKSDPATKVVSAGSTSNKSEYVSGTSSVNKVQDKGGYLLCSRKVKWSLYILGISYQQQPGRQSAPNRRTTDGRERSKASDIQKLGGNSWNLRLYDIGLQVVRACCCASPRLGSAPEVKRLCSQPAGQGQPRLYVYTCAILL